MSKTFSIITTNYNGFNLMKKYFESLENQTFKDFEIIIVDDCSSDSSYNEIAKYQRNSKNELLLFKTGRNCGPGGARNIGLEHASGEYVTFIDNDDWIESDLLEKINSIIINKKYDCIIYDYYMDFENGKTIKCNSVYGKFQNEMNKTDAIKYVRNHSVCKFYKNSVLKNNNIKYPIIRRHEDIAFVGSALTKCNTFYYLNIPMYHYVQIKKSLSRNNQLNDSTIDIAYEILKNSYGKKYEKELKEKSVMDLLYNKLLIMCKINTSNKEIRDFIVQYNSNNIDWDKYEILNYIGRSKRMFLKLARKKRVLCLKILSFIHSLLGG